jgi:hypothetical protein
MNEQEQDRMKKLLKQALPPVAEDMEPTRDLWPAMLERIDRRPAANPHLLPVWFDWALLAGLVGVAAAFPASIPLLLYYL